MVLVLRREKGGPLTSDELDCNFEWLEEKIQALEDIPSQGEGIDQVVQEGSQIRLIGSYGTDFGVFSIHQNLRIYKDSLPEKPDDGEMVIFEKDGIFTLLLYAGESWRKAYNGEVFHNESH